MQDIEKNRVMSSTLYLVGTPIGNLSDLSERAKKVLSSVDFIAAEDTRNSQKLLSLFDIHKETVSYHEHNKKSSGEKIIERLKSGESCALITDAGMPAISDPGEDLVRLCAENGVCVSVIPGPCAAVSALAVSALATGKFVFEGFLPVSGKERRDRLAFLQSETRTVIFYEAPHKLCATLSDLCDAFGDERKISLCRELTKINEEVARTTIGEAVKRYAQKEPRGEYVLVMEGAKEIKKDVNASLLDLSPAEHVSFYEKRGLAHMDAIKAATKERGLSKSEFYKLLLN